MVEHVDGYMPARIPRRHTMLKTMPTTGWRKGKASRVVDGKWTSIMMIARPRKENARSDTDVELMSLVKPSPYCLSKL
jgi:hypothetical protein